MCLCMSVMCVEAIGYKAVKLDWNNFKAFCFLFFRLDIVPEKAAELKLMRLRRPGPRRGALAMCNCQKSMLYQNRRIMVD